jgi:DNA-binding response OmpR family regulator
MELDSTPGVGSRFTVRLPDARTAAAGPTDPASTDAAPTDPASTDAAPTDAASTTAGSPARGGAGILLIEDDPSAARLLRTYLDSAGYRVRVAGSGEAGLIEARRERPEAVILDILLPGIDGWGVLREIKQDARLQDVPVFVASVVDERDVGLSLGATDFFVKPIDRRQLLARVAEFLLGQGASGDPMHILAVDEDSAALELLTRALRDQRVDVVTAGTGQEAVRLARTRPFDLIISDFRMPDIDGVNLMIALDEDPATSSIPVLVVTGSELSDTDRSRLHATKVLGILPKGEALIKALHHWMTRLPRPSAQSRGKTGPEDPS